MPENYEHYITKNIKAFYRRRLLAPILYLLLLFAVWKLFSLSSLLMPDFLDESTTLETAYRNDTEYVNAALYDLKFTGYTRNIMGYHIGYYYYTVRNGECIIVLLSPDSCEEGLPVIECITATGKIVRGSKDFDGLLDSLSADLNWTQSGIRDEVSQFMLSEPDYNRIGNILLFLVFFVTGGYAASCTVRFLLFICFPLLSPPCQDLALFGNPKKLLAQAEDELATLPQLATEDMFITEHFFIETSVYGNAIVPINQIIWIYKYSTLHKFFWYHFSISYTLHISAKKHLYIQCPKNIKSDIDGIIDYLAEANHKILVGFNEANRLKVQKIQGTPMHFEKFIEFLNRRI